MKAAGPERKESRYWLFEPWGIGDVSIALLAAKTLHEQGCLLWMNVAPHLAEWVSEFDFVQRVTRFVPPWTAAERKYSPSRYHLNAILELRRKYKTLDVDGVCDLRGDIRNQLLYKILPHKANFSPLRINFTNRYERVDWIVRTILGSNVSYKPIESNKGASIWFFPFAGSDNRKLPAKKCRLMVKKLSSQIVKKVSGHLAEFCRPRCRNPNRQNGSVQCNSFRPAEAERLQIACCQA